MLFRNMGSMTPQASSQVNVMNGLSMNVSQHKPDFIIESAHVKHSYNTNMWAQGGARGNLPQGEIEEIAEVPTEVSPQKRRSGHKKNYFSMH